MTILLSTSMILAATMAGAEGLDPPLNRYANAAGTVGRTIVVVGGTDAQDGHQPTNTTDLLDTTTGSWTRGADMPTARDFPAVVSLGDRVMEIGGLLDDGGASGAVETYHPDDDRWSTQPPMASKRSRMGACVIDGRVYVAGGMGEIDAVKDGAMPTLEKWDPTTGAWERLADMREGRHGHGVVAYDGEVWVIGGYTADGMTDSVEIYDPRTNAWREGPALPAKRGFADVAVVNDRIYVINSRSNLAHTSVIYEDGTWHEGPAVPDDRHRCGVAVVGERIYLVTGDTGDRPFPEPHTIYLDLKTSEWGSVGE